MKTTGVSPEALAASISRFSRSEIDAMTNSPPGLSPRSVICLGETVVAIVYSFLRPQSVPTVVAEC